MRWRNQGQDSDHAIHHHARSGDWKVARQFANWRSAVVLALSTLLFAGALFAFPSITRPQLLVNETVTPEVAALFPLRNAVNAIILYTGALDPDDDGKLNLDALQEAVEREVPRVYQGPVCLDWEGRATSDLILNPHTQAFQAAIREFVNGLVHARRVRPLATFGYYGLPIGSFVRDEHWVNTQLNLQPIYDASDCLFPSVYDHYATGQPYAIETEDLDYVREIVAMALRVSKGKPVYPYVAARYHEGNAQYGMALILRDEFKQHVSEVFKARFGEHRAGGIVWWGADRYCLWLSRQNFPIGHPLRALSLRCREVFAAEFLPGETDDQHFTRIHKVILKRLDEVVSAFR